MASSGMILKQSCMMSAVGQIISLDSQGSDGITSLSFLKMNRNMVKNKLQTTLEVTLKYSIMTASESLDTFSSSTIFITTNIRSDGYIVFFLC